MSCPFKHLWAEGSEGAPKDANHNSINKTLPNPPSQQENKSSVETETSGTMKQTCPAGYGGKETTAAPASGSPGPATAAPGKCPLGYGSSAGPKLSALHCIICKSLLFDCAITNCGHRFCSQCISHMKDCPACGADIESTSADPDTQATVDTFLEVHAGDSSIWEMEGTATASDKEALAHEDRGKPAFLLQVALRAMSGWNIPSALARLEQCRECLEAELHAVEDGGSAQALGLHGEGQGHREASHLTPSHRAAHVNRTNGANNKADALRCKLGAVCGCIGDCIRKDPNGDMDETLAAYEASIEYLRVSAAGGNTEAHHALSVTLNKIGEVYHLDGDVERAAAFYSESLELRKARFQDILNDRDRLMSEEGVSAGLDVAISQAKVADALEESGKQVDAAQHLVDADALLALLEPGVGLVSQGLRFKYEMVRQHVRGPE